MKMDSSVGKGQSEEEKLMYECDRLWFRGPCSRMVNFEIKSFKMGISPDIAGKGKRKGKGKSKVKVIPVLNEALCRP
jgi:hypothetical protein